MVGIFLLDDVIRKGSAEKGSIKKLGSFLLKNLGCSSGKCRGGRQHRDHKDENDPISLLNRVQSCHLRTH